VHALDLIQPEHENVNRPTGSQYEESNAGQRVTPKRAPRGKERPCILVPCRNRMSIPAFPHDLSLS
jgi:hypothetical protein